MSDPNGTIWEQAEKDYNRVEALEGKYADACDLIEEAKGDQIFRESDNYAEWLQSVEKHGKEANK